MRRNRSVAALAAAMTIAAMTLTGCGSSAATETNSGSAEANLSSVQAIVDTAETTSTSSGSIALNALPYVLDTTEYALYQNIFYNDMAEDYADKEVTKSGVFTTLEDKYNGVTRYYIWGYNDETKCCDWQWELKLEDTADLPVNGSQVKVTGTLTADESSLDGYWITDPELTVTEEYDAPDCDVNMTAMSATLEYVQMANIQYAPEDFEGQTVYAFGRIASGTSIQHPYYDSVWEEEFTSEDTVPSTGTVVLVTGTLKDGVISDASVAETDLY